MKINWFKINKKELFELLINSASKITKQESSYQFSIRKHIISYLNIGNFCKDCGADFVRCECNDYIIDFEKFYYNLINYNFSLKNKHNLINDLMNKIFRINTNKFLNSFEKRSDIENINCFIGLIS